MQGRVRLESVKPIPATVAMRVLFRVATAFLFEGWLLRVFLCIRALWIEILVGLIPVFAFFYLGFPIGKWRTALAMLLGLFVAIAGIVVAATLGMLIRIRRLSSHEYGLCTGYTK